VNGEPTLQELEQALMERARRLADEYLARARSTVERMISDENERLRIREERAVLAAELEAERLYRSKVQATEMELQGELDRRRWEMVQQLKEKIGQQLARVADGDDYTGILKSFLASAVKALDGEGDLVCHLCDRDLERFRDEWPAWIREVAPGRSIELAGSDEPFSGGLLVRNSDDTVRVNHTFEGRLERLDGKLNLVLTAELFPAVTASGAEVFDG
jgi:V/A-type H+-transporting ATPase subunit E